MSTVEEEAIRGLLEAQAERGPPAKEPFEDADPDAVWIALDYARLLESRGHYREAVGWYERIWNLREHHSGIAAHAAHAAHNVGWLCSQDGHRAEALGWHERAYSLRHAGPEATEAAYLSAVARGWLHARAGEADSADLWFDRSIYDGQSWYSNGMRHSDPPLELTPPQEERLTAVAREWLDTFTSPVPVDRHRVEQLIGHLYERAHRRPPRFLWCDSPASGWRSLPATASDVGAPIPAEFLLPEAHDVCWHVRSQRRRSLKGSSVTGMGKHLRYGISLLPERTDHGEGSHYLDWHYVPLLFVATFCRDELGVRYPDPVSEVVDCWKEVTQRVALWMPFEAVCVVAG